MRYFFFILYYKYKYIYIFLIVYNNIKKYQEKISILSNNFFFFS